jgi:hypothetical protein
MLRRDEEQYPSERDRLDDYVAMLDHVFPCT